MATVPKSVPPITVEQFLRFEQPPGFKAELLHGEIVLSPDPKPLHHDVALKIYNFLHGVLPKEFWKVGMRCNISFPADHYMPSPDVFVIEQRVWRKAKKTDAYPATAPLLMVEVVSPSNTKPRVMDKKKFYLEHGSQAVWVVYPQFQLLYEYVPGKKEKRYLKADRIELPTTLNVNRSGTLVEDFFED